MLELFDQGKGTGLAIGPLCGPVIRRGDAHVHYVDVHAVDQLQA